MGSPFCVSPSLSLGVSLSRNEFIDHTPIYRPQPRLQKDGLSLIAFPDFLQRNISPDLDHPATAILPSSRNAGKTKPHTKSFKELLHRIGQPTRLAPPGYADSTRLRTSFTWGRWTKFVDCFIHALTFLRERRLTRPALDSVRKSMRSPTISRLPIPSTFARTISTTKSSGRF
jgi:hypothetical protein